MKTAVNATTLAIAAFIVPYCFGMNSALLFIDCSILEGIIAFVTAIVGLYAIAAALRGYGMTKISVPYRLLFAAGGLCLMFPGTLTDLIGLALVFLGTALETVKKNKELKAAK